MGACGGHSGDCTALGAPQGMLPSAWRTAASRLVQLEVNFLRGDSRLEQSTLSEQ